MKNKSQLNELNVPKLRFKGFFDKWESKTIDELFIFINGLSGLSSTNFGSGNDKYIEYIEIYKNKNLDDSCGKNFNLYNSVQNIIEYDDILVTATSETPEDIGVTSIYKGNNKIYLNSFCFALRSIENNINCNYINYLFSSKLYRKKIIGLGQGFTRINISKKKFCKISVVHPSYNEQEKIAYFFSLLDKQIELYETKLQLNELKYSFYTSILLKKIITKNKCKLSKYLIPVKSYPISNLENKTPISISLYGKGLKKSSLKIKLSKSGRPYFIRQEGELIIGAQNFHNGSVAILGDEYINPIMSNAIYSFNTTHIEPKILLKIFLSRDFKNILNRISSGTGQKEFSLKEILNVDFFEIDIELSKLCTKFFDIYDTKIYFMKRNVELIKMKKMYFLQKLFI